MNKIFITCLTAALALGASLHPSARADGPGDSGIQATGGYPNLLFQVPPVQSSQAALRSNFAGMDLPRPASPRGTGDVVLYDQTIPFTEGAPAQQFERDNEAFDAWGVDDFSVTDVNGWSVSTFNFHAGFLEDGAQVDPPEGTLYNVDIYPDDDRRPGATPVCSYSELPGQWDSASMYVLVELPEACELPTGNYWLAFQAVVDTPTRAFWLNSWFDVTIFRRTAMWKNPGGGFELGCEDWDYVSLCQIGNSIPNFIFQVIGQPNSDMSCTDEGVCLRMTAVPFDRDVPDQCGETAGVSVNVGDRVNLCYRVTNNTGLDLDYQMLTDNLDGEIFTQLPRSLAPGETWQMNRIVRVAEATTLATTWSAQDVLGDSYSMTVTESNFVDISDFGTELEMPFGMPAGVEMPFSFNLYDQTTNQLCVGLAGLIEVGVLSCQGLSPPFTNDDLPYFNFTTPVILPFWEMLWLEGVVYHATLGEAPDRRFVVQWHQKDRLGQQGDGRTTFQVVIEEGTSQISFEYLDMEFGDPNYDYGADATVGLQWNTDYADQYSHNEPVIFNDSAIVWTISQPEVFTTTAEVVIDAGAPQATFGSEELTAVAAAGSTVLVPLEITNTGDGVLEWRLAAGSDAPSDAHLPAQSASVPLAGHELSFSTGPAPWVSETVITRQRAEIPFSIDDVPAYALNWSLGDLYQLSAEWPRDWLPIGSYGEGLGVFFTSMDFLDGNLDVLYALDADAREIVTLDTETAQLTVVGALQGVAADSVTGFKQDPTTGILYLSTITGEGHAAFSQLWTLDSETLEATLIGTISDSIAIIDIAFDVQGRLYGVDIGLDTFLAIDKETGQAGVIGELGFNANFVSDLAFDFQTNRLYFSGVEHSGGFTPMREIWKIDIATGAARHLGGLSESPWVISSSATLAIAREPGVCSAAAGASWLSWENAAGSVAAGETGTADIALDASELEPGIYHADLCVHTNDQQRPAVQVPVSLEVTEPLPDPIFADRFEPLSD